MHKIEVVVVMDNLFGRHICTVMKLKLEKHIKQQRGGIYNSMQRQLFDKIESIISSYIYFQGKILPIVADLFFDEADTIFELCLYNSKYLQTSFTLLV